jgi:hypothetical protein
MSSSSYITENVPKYVTNRLSTGESGTAQSMTKLCLQSFASLYRLKGSPMLSLNSIYICLSAERRTLKIT